MQALAPLVAEGAFASCNPRTLAPAGAGVFVGGYPAGVITGRFGWGDPATGQVQNTRTSPAQLLGLVLPEAGTWQKIYQSRGTWSIRAGLPCTLCARGDFWVRFAGGAYPGQLVYASLVDGSAIAGYSADAELTPWAVITSCDAGGLAIISTWSSYTNG